MGNARQVAERFYRSFAAGDFEAILACFDPACSSVSPAGRFDNAGHDTFIRTFKKAVPDAHMEIVRAVEAGDEVFIGGRLRGRHSGDLVSPRGVIAASGNSLDLAFADYFRVRDGVAVEHEVLWDQAEMLRQLGVSRASQMQKGVE